MIKSEFWALIASKHTYNITKVFVATVDNYVLRTSSTVIEGKEMTEMLQPRSLVSRAFARYLKV